VTTRIELDTVIEKDETIESVMAKMIEGFDVKAEVVTAFGPGGGHPIIAYTGERDQLRALTLKHYGADTVDLINL
jgi:hypothetical protein